MTALAVALRASLDPTISTEALRVYLGIAGQVWSKIKIRDGDKVAYISLDEVYVCSGVTAKAVPGLLADLARLGLEQVEDGQRGAEEDGHGVATAWDACPSEFKPLVLDEVDPSHLSGLCRFLDPAGGNWERNRAGSAGWRAAAVLVASYGLTETSFTASWLAAQLGVHRSNAGSALRRLEVLGVVERDGRKWRWWPLLLVHDIENEVGILTDARPSWNRLARYNRRRPWLNEHRPKWIEQKIDEASREAQLRRRDSDRSMAEFLDAEAQRSGVRERRQPDAIDKT